MKTKPYNRKADVIYISEHINDLPHRDRVEVVKKLDFNKLAFKGTGTTIKFKDIPDAILYDIANNIRDKLEYSEMRLNESLGF